jgi:hypothetical protein
VCVWLAEMVVSRAWVEILFFAKVSAWCVVVV